MVYHVTQRKKCSQKFNIWNILVCLLVTNAFLVLLLRRVNAREFVTQENYNNGDTKGEELFGNSTVYFA